MDERLLRYQKLSDPDREQFRIALNTLLTESFLLRSLESHARAYKFAAGNTEILDAYLELAGWGLRKDENLGVISFDGPASARLQLKKDESILLLVLRLLYEEKSGELTLHGERTLRQQEIQDRLRTAADLSYRKTRFLALLRRFQALRLIQLRGSEEDPETTVILLPSIPFVLDGVSVEEIAARIEAYRAPSEDGRIDDDGDGEQEASE
ncbi:MAG: DUF4194 domain-containing protein [Spirochaetes bacterium]|jgi:hypothetical protein|nr:DUF4194 domain-containing protein [Spirochaetota bacterium]